MACLRVFPAVFAAAVGVAPPAVIPPVQPASSYVGGEATQTLRTNAELAGAWMPSATAAAPLAPRVAGRAPIASRTGASEAELMKALSDFARKEHASGTAEHHFSGGRLAIGKHGLPEPQAATSPTHAMMKIFGVFSLAFVSAAAAVRWWSHRRASNVMEETVSALELGTLNEKFAVASSTSKQPFDPMGMNDEKIWAAEIQNGCAIMTSYFALHVVKLPGGSNTAVLLRRFCVNCRAAALAAASFRSPASGMSLAATAAGARLRSESRHIVRPIFAGFATAPGLFAGAPTCRARGLSGRPALGLGGIPEITASTSSVGRPNQIRLKAVLRHLRGSALVAAKGRADGSYSNFVGCASAIAAAGLATGCVSATAAESKSTKPLSFKQIATLPRPGMQSIGSTTFLPDGSHILYLRSEGYGTLSRQLYATNVATGETRSVACTPPGTGEEAELSLEEKLRRERARIMNTGVTSFKVAGPKGSCGRLLVPMGGALYMREGIGEDAALSRLFDPAAAPLGPGPILDPQISEDGSLVCFVWREEVYCVPADGSKPPRQLTAGARGTGVTHGLADFLAQEELDRYEGFWISPDGSKVAFEAVDETHIPQYRIMHQGSADVGEGAQEDHRYPFAGRPNPKVRLHVVSTAAGEGAAAGGVPPTSSFDLTGPFGEDFYLGRVQWMPDGTIVAQVLNRDQTRLAVLRLDPTSGSVKELFAESTNVWINIHDMLKPLKDGRMLWASERSGHRHLYIYENGKLRELTSGAWQVEDIAAVDEEAGLVYFCGTGPGKWLERHLFRVSLSGGGTPEQVTLEPGMHSAVVNLQSGTFVDTYSSANQPAVAMLRSLRDGKSLHVVFKNEDPLIAELGMQPPEFVSFPSTDGKVELQAALYRPDPKSFGPGPYPVVVSCYGGPHVQFVSNSWMMTVDLRAQAMVSRGCLVLKVDNRGSNRRGLAFEAPVKHDMGSIEVDDQAAGVQWCVNRGLADQSRVAIYGWSYGGYLSAMCLAKAANVFKCAVSGAPVTSWDGYDTCYTERYMGTPEANPKGYKSSSVMEHVDGIKGDLLLVHGLIDENVHFRHTARLINALIEKQKPYQLLLFPNERHSPRSQKDREYMEERIWAFIETSLAL